MKKFIVWLLFVALLLSPFKSDAGSLTKLMLADLRVKTLTADDIVFAGLSSVAGVAILLPQENDAVTPTLAFGDGDSGWYESADDTLVAAIAGAAKVYINATGLGYGGTPLAPSHIFGSSDPLVRWESTNGAGAVFHMWATKAAQNQKYAIIVRPQDYAGKNGWFEIYDDTDSRTAWALTGESGIIYSSTSVTCATNVCTDSARYALYVTTENSAAADVLTVADAVAGQVRLIILKTDGGDDLEITPTNFANGTKITLDTAGESALIHFDGTNWVVVETYGGVVS